MGHGARGMGHWAEPPSAPGMHHWLCKHWPRRWNGGCGGACTWRMAIVGLRANHTAQWNDLYRKEEKLIPIMNKYQMHILALV